MDYSRKAGSYVDEKLGEFTGGMNFPASKDDIVAQAKQKHLPPDVIERLEKMPDRKYNDIADLISSAVRE